MESINSFFKNDDIKNHGIKFKTNNGLFRIVDLGDFKTWFFSIIGNSDPTAHNTKNGFYFMYCPILDCVEVETITFDQADKIVSNISINGEKKYIDYTTTSNLFNDPIDSFGSLLTSLSIERKANLFIFKIT